MDAVNLDKPMTRGEFNNILLLLQQTYSPMNSGRVVIDQMRLAFGQVVLGIPMNKRKAQLEGKRGQSSRQLPPSEDPSQQSHPDLAPPE